MVTLFDQEKVLEIHDYNLVKDASAEGLPEMDWPKYADQLQKQ